MDKFDDLLNKEKEKIKSQKLSEEFKTKLSNKLNFEYENTKNVKKNNLFYKYRKVAVGFACCIIISGFVFADNIENWVSSIFKNIDKNGEFSIEDDNIQNVNSEYVTSNDIAVNVEYIYYDDYNFYIACNVKKELEFENMFFDKVKILNQDGVEIYNSEIIKPYDIINIKIKRIDKSTTMILMHLHKNQKIEKFKNINIELNNLLVKSNNEPDIIEGNWNFNIDINNNMKINN
jgi:hypothetical protein